MSFDRVISFEKSLLKPSDFWSGVPMKWQPFWSFFNIPVTTTPQSSASSPSPLRFIEQLASPEDFISFKLDIDFPDIEIQLAQEIAANANNITSLIDEFFFEIHFHCEIMMQCGWRKDAPAVGGLPLDRLSILTFFQEFRKKGIRSHFWP